MFLDSLLDHMLLQTAFSLLKPPSHLQAPLSPYPSRERTTPPRLPDREPPPPATGSARGRNRCHRPSSPHMEESTATRSHRTWEKPPPPVVAARREKSPPPPPVVVARGRCHRRPSSPHDGRSHRHHHHTP
uniref:Uncharacterized protein n=1 Tax=Oryza nivara TaxID=4536 RepID=A0A0E0IJX1_ORYNI